MKKLFLLAGSAIMLSLSANAQCTEIFFSEYIEGSGNSKAVEIYNPTSSAIDLSGYSIFNIVNGGTATNSFALYGSLPAYGVFIIADQCTTSKQWTEIIQLFLKKLAGNENCVSQD